LDTGTGLGLIIEVLQESLPGYSSIVGIDTKQEVLETATAKFQDERIKFRCMDGEHIEFERVHIFQYNTHEEQLRSENLEEEKVTLDQCFEAMEAKLHRISDKN
jgi:ubiquinone/menaquinone biosynthesis C-methylase UbiE